MLSDRLQTLLDKLSNPNPITRVRLVRETKAVWEKEFPEAVKGKAQLEGMKAAVARKNGGVTIKSKPTPFAEWLAEKLAVSVPTVESLIRRGRYVPEEVLLAIEEQEAHLKQETGSRIRAMGGLLEKLVSAFSSERVKVEGQPDWNQIIQDHIYPPQVESLGLDGGLNLGGPYLFLGENAGRHLRALIGGGFKFDSIIIDPPYGMKHNGLVNGTMADDERGALWVVPLLAQLITPGRAVCLWCNGGTFGRWARALLKGGFVIVECVRWNKLSSFQDRRGDEFMIVASIGTFPATFAPAFSEIKQATYPANAPERRIHDTPKPPELFAPIIARWTQPGEVVLDCFAGLAPVGVACLNAGRQYHGYELVPKIAVHALRRLREAAPKPLRRPVTDEDRERTERHIAAKRAAASGPSPAMR